MADRIKVHNIWIDKTVKIHATVGGLFCSLVVEKKDLQHFPSLRNEIKALVRRKVIDEGSKLTRESVGDPDAD